MKNKEAVITGIGVVAANGIGKDNFWLGLEEGRDAVSEITSFVTEKFPMKLAAEIKEPRL